MKLFSTLLALTLTMPVIASAQTIEAADDLTGYTRFLVYPHLQHGWESMRRGDRGSALAELERARSLAPNNATVALHLATAYQTFGELRRAESLLRAQITLTPRDPRLPAALSALQTIMRPSATPPVATTCIAREGVPCSEVRTSSDQRAAAASSAVASTSARAATAGGSRRDRDKNSEPLPPPPAVQLDDSGDTPPFAAEFTVALQAGDFDRAQRQADAWLAHDAGNGALLDTVTYQLVAAGATEQATGVLLQAYPFASRTPAERDTLVQRLIMLIDQQDLLAAERLAPLRQPLDTPGLRSRQAVLWERLNDCPAIRALLADMSPAYGYDDWMRLGDCSSAADPALAERAYMNAHTLQPGGRGSRALGYQAHATGDFDVALDAWRSVGAENLAGDELLAAVTSAVAGGAVAQATNWLHTYHARGETLNHRYWSLLADTTLRSDPSTAADA